jgi:GH15 family glucan-1,4-alpha-glucosidase
VSPGGYPPVEDYALIGDTHSAGLVSRDGSIDWLCLPRFDSPACFAALLDKEQGGRWRIAAVDGTATRAYREDSMVLETQWETPKGRATVIDCLPIEDHVDPTDPRLITTHDVFVRIVRGVEGEVEFDMEYSPRFDYGNVVPWMRLHEHAVEAVGGPDALDLRANVPLQLEGATVTASFVARPGDAHVFLAAHHPSHTQVATPSFPDDCEDLVGRTDDFWRDWAGGCRYDGRWRDEVIRSLLTLKALTYSPTGGIVAAPTTSLPEWIGGVRNWDYRYCWLRDATFTLETLLRQGYTAEASEWRDWLLRAVAGDPEDLQIMYSVDGSRRLIEYEVEWLEGYEGSSPVRVGNAAVQQFQLDVYGEVMDSFLSARNAGIGELAEAWELERHIAEFVCEHWDEPDDGIWEVRSGRRHFVHSKVMAWVAIDRAVKAVEHFGKEGPVDHWRDVRGAIRSEIMERGVDAERGVFVRSYDSKEMDASLLMLPLVGFIEATDPVMRATIEQIEKDLLVDGFVLRYDTATADDGLPPGEGVFLLCTFWLVDCLAMCGRHDDALALFEKLIALCNDVGLLSEQYDPGAGRLLGNYPQAFSHIALITSAMTLEQNDPATMRRGLLRPEPGR